MKQLFGSSLLVLVMLVGTACGGSYQGPQASPTATPRGGKPGEVGPEVAMTARYATFQPSSLTVTKGQAIRLKITSSDVAHTLTIDELGINIAVGAGQTVVQDIKVDKAGTFRFYCAVPGHRRAGMEGTLKAEE